MFNTEWKQLLLHKSQLYTKVNMYKIEMVLCIGYMKYWVVGIFVRYPAMARCLHLQQWYEAVALTLSEPFRIIIAEK